MRPMPRLFTSLTLFVFLLGLIACMPNSVVQPGLTEFSVDTPDPLLATPQPVPPEEVAMGATSTPIIDTTATAASVTIEAVLAATRTPDLAATGTSLAQQMATAVAATLPALPILTPLLPPTNTPLPAPPLFTASINTTALNLRTGPGSVYPVIKNYPQDTVVTILGKEPGQQWLKVRTPDGQVGWMARTYLQFSGRLVDIPIVDIPPAPTPTG